MGPWCASVMFRDHYLVSGTYRIIEYHIHSGLDVTSERATPRRLVSWICIFPMKSSTLLPALLQQLDESSCPQAQLINQSTQDLTNKPSRLFINKRSSVRNKILTIRQQTLVKHQRSDIH